MYKQIIYGPPGTGKTTELLNILEDELKKNDPEDIAFVSFTRKGVYEGKIRAMDRFNISNKSLEYFRTIHSLAFKECNITRGQVLSKKHYKQFSIAMGMKFTGYYTEEYFHNDDRYLFYDTLERNTPGIAKKLLDDLDLDKVKYVLHNFKRFKDFSGRLDFTDMLTRYIAEGEPIKVKVAIIDEAQDLTTLQWRVIEKAFSKVDRLYIAGDDDQAIYQWDGADVDYFLNLDGDKKLLDTSWRLPSSILNFSNQITNQIGLRVKKDFHSAEQTGAGEVKYYADLAELNINTAQSWLFLARNNYHLTGYSKIMADTGLNYSYKGEKFASEKDIRLIKIFEQFTRDRQQPQGESRILLENVINKDINLNLPWFYNFNWTLTKTDYYRNLFKNKTDITNYPNLHINTIHGSKGGEADNVVLLMDITKSVEKTCQSAPDSELRCLYVGATRTKKKLHIIYSKGKYSYEKFIQGEK